MQMSNSHLARCFLFALSPGQYTLGPTSPHLDTTLPLSSFHPWGGLGRERSRFFHLFEDDPTGQTNLWGGGRCGLPFS